MDIRHLTVTELILACVDEEFRAAMQEGRRPSTQRAPAAGEPAVGGVVFHQIAHRFVTALAEGGKASAAPEELWPRLYTGFAEKELDRLAGLGQIETAINVSTALQAFATRLGVVRASTPGFQHWSDVFVTQEHHVQDVPFAFPEHECTIFVSGRIDAVRHHPERGLELVDYKLSRSAHLQRDLLQLAVYARLLETRGLQLAGVLEFYSPEFEAVTATHEELRGIFADVVEPVLRSLSGGAAVPPTSPAAPSRGREIERCYAQFGLKVQVVEEVEAPQLIRYIVKPAAGVRVVSLASRASDLQVALSLPALPRIEASSEGVIIELPKPVPDRVLWRDLLQRAEWRGQESPLAFAVGLGVDGRLIIGDFSDPNTCHALVAGVAGSGKSEWLKAMVCSLVQRNAPAELRLTLIDPKLLTFRALEGLPHLRGPIITNLEETLASLEAAVGEMERRYQTLAREGFANLPERFAGGQRDLPFLVFVCDEFADLVLVGGAEKKRFEELVARLAAKGRAAGIHLVLATQRPDRQIVTGLIKANLPLKVCLRVTNATNSQIVLDQPGAERLLGRGDLLCDLGRGLRRAQAPLVTGEDIQELCRRAGAPAR